MCMISLMTERASILTNTMAFAHGRMEQFEVIHGTSVIPHIHLTSALRSYRKSTKVKLWERLQKSKYVCYYHFFTNHIPLRDSCSVVIENVSTSYRISQGRYIIRVHICIIVLYQAAVCCWNRHPHWLKQTLLTLQHCNDVITIAMASQITSLTIVHSTVYSGVDQRKHQSFASLTFLRGNHRWPVNSPHKGSVTRKIFSFDDVIMDLHGHRKIMKLKCCILISAPAVS